MIELGWELIPALLGIVASPLAIMALIATLLSRRARGNGVSFLIGWIGAVVITVAVVFALADGAFRAEHADEGASPLVGIIRVVIAGLLGAGAVWTYRRARASIASMANARTPEEIAAAAPQLPGWLQSVSRFTPPRSLLLGFGIFVLNPINVACAIAAVLDVETAGLPEQDAVLVVTVFCILCIVPMVIPVVLLLIAGSRAEAPLQRLRGWIVKNNGVLSAGFLAIVAFTQIQKAIQAWV